MLTKCRVALSGLGDKKSGYKRLEFLISNSKNLIGVAGWRIKKPKHSDNGNVKLPQQNY